MYTRIKLEQQDKKARLCMSRPYRFAEGCGGDGAVDARAANASVLAQPALA